MESLAQKVCQLLDHAEAQIRMLGAEAFRAGQDNDVSQARDVVEVLKTLKQRLTSQVVITSQVLTEPQSASIHHTSMHEQGGHRRKAMKHNYPKYEVRNGALVRTGWSKKQRAEYEHKAPKEVFDRTVAAMAQVAQSGKGPFAAEKIIEQANNSEVVPNYQAYLVIGLLRDHGCVERVGREGYMIPGDVLACASQIWNQLVETNK